MKKTLLLLIIFGAAFWNIRYGHARQFSHLDVDPTRTQQYIVEDTGEDLVPTCEENLNAATKKLKTLEHVQCKLGCYEGYDSCIDNISYATGSYYYFNAKSKCNLVKSSCRAVCAMQEVQDKSKDLQDAIGDLNP